MKVFKQALGCSALLLLGSSIGAKADVIYSVDIESLYNDNIYLLENNEVDSAVGIVRPGVLVEMIDGANKYSVEAEAESGTYTQSVSEDDDYTDYHVSAKSEMEFTMRNRLQLDLTHEKGHDERGSGRQDAVGKSLLTLSDNPDLWRDNALDAMYTYGGENARARVSFGGNFRNFEYTNNRPGTYTLDHDDTEYRVIGYLKALPRSEVLLEVRTKDIEYDETTPADRDSTDDRYFIGYEWDSTAKTTGSIRLGYQRKNPDDPTLDSFDSTAWEAKVLWQPKRYSVVSFEAFRGAEDSSNSVSSVDTTFYVVNWRHDWTSRLTTDLYALHKNDDYSDVVREDDVDGFGFGVSYELTEWMKLKGGYDYSERDTSVAGLDYEQNKVLVGLDIELR